MEVAVYIVNAKTRRRVYAAYAGEYIPPEPQQRYGVFVVNGERYYMHHAEYLFDVENVDLLIEWHATTSR